MYKLKNCKPKFLPLDVVKIIKTGSIAIITETNCNTCQSKDIHQWSYSLDFIDKKKSDYNAWYSNDELELITNIYEIIIKNMERSNTSNNFQKLNRRTQSRRG